MIYQIQKLIDDQIRPSLSLHRGDIELVDVDNDLVFIRFSGGCQGCAASTNTLKAGIERLIKEKFPSIKEVVDLTRHEEGKDPFIKR